MNDIQMYWGYNTIKPTLRLVYEHEEEEKKAIWQGIELIS